MKAALGLLVAVAVAVGLAEVVMQPSGDERGKLLTLFTLLAVGTAVVGWLLSLQMRHFRSLRSAVLLIALAAVVAVALSTAVAARMMFLQPHDLRLLAVVLGFAVGLGAVLATTLANRLTGDLRRIGSTAAHVARGDLTARTGVVRADELGIAAAAVDDMAEALGVAEEGRRRDDEARRHFLSAVGHDLRSPLAAMRAAVEAIEDGLADDPARYLRSMQRDIEAMSHLVDDLFLFSTIEAGRLDIEVERLDLSEIADDSIEALRPVAAERQVELRLDAAGGVYVDGGVTELGRVIRNLLHNAIRFAPSGSEVVVAVSGEGGVGTVEVSDTGPGFSSEMAGRAFEEFVTGDPSRSRLNGGAGLGLAIARGLIAAHDGEIWATPGPGACVGFRIGARRQ